MGRDDIGYDTHTLNDNAITTIINDVFRSIAQYRVLIDKVPTCISSTPFFSGRSRSYISIYHFSSPDPYQNMNIKYLTTRHSRLRSLPIFHSNSARRSPPVQASR